jgi:hypothetical protein
VDGLLSFQGKSHPQICPDAAYGIPKAVMRHSRTTRNETLREAALFSFAVAVPDEFTEGLRQMLLLPLSLPESALVEPAGGDQKQSGPSRPGRQR